MPLAARGLLYFLRRNSGPRARAARLRNICAGLTPLSLAHDQPSRPLILDLHPPPPPVYTAAPPVVDYRKIETRDMLTLDPKQACPTAPPPHRPTAPPSHHSPRVGISRISALPSLDLGSNPQGPASFPLTPKLAILMTLSICPRVHVASQVGTDFLGVLLNPPWKKFGAAAGIKADSLARLRLPQLCPFGARERESPRLCCRGRRLRARACGRTNDGDSFCAGIAPDIFHQNVSSLITAI